jgi:aminopeptidase
MASYLATIQIGRYELVPMGSGPVKAIAAVPPRRRGAFKTTFRRQAEMVELFSRLFGPYPFAQYTVVITDDPLEIPLEAQGMSVFGANFLDGKRGQERLVAHELAHQWFGNSLTIDAWQHIWLHEGFACYAEWLWAEHSGGPTAERAAAGALVTVRSVPQDLAIGDPGPVRMFDNRVYLRGALTVHALRRRLGDTVFFELIQEWTAQNRYGSVNTEKFLDLVDRRGGDVVQLRRWLFETALPT